MEEQTNANAEELDTRSGEQTALNSPDIQTEEAAKKSARTLKMKATEAGDKVTSEEPTPPPQQRAILPLTQVPAEREKASRAVLGGDASDVPSGIRIFPAPTP